MPQVRIIEELCDGCGDCIPACHEGALRVVEGKARLVEAAACDGAGACIGECPRGAIVFEDAAMPEAPLTPSLHDPLVGAHTSCPGAAPRVVASTVPGEPAAASSALRQWPIQLHLLSPAAPFLAGSNLLLAADCAAYACGGFHGHWLAGRTLAIACPKLDSGQEVYEEKLVAMLRHASLASVTVLIMEVPCCSGLVRLLERAAARAGVAVPMRVAVLGVDGALTYDSSQISAADACAVG